MQEDTVGPDSVLPFKILRSRPGFIFLFEFGREGHLISVWVHILWSGQSLKPPLRTVLVRSCEVGGRSSSLLVILSGQYADGCPRLDIYSLRWLPFYWSCGQTNSAQCNERLSLNYFPVYVVVLTFVFTKWKISPNFAHCNDTAPYCRRFWSGSILPNGLREVAK